MSDYVPGLVTDNAAVLARYTVEYIATHTRTGATRHISTKRRANMRGVFRAFDHDGQRFVTIESWYYSFAPVTQGG